VREHGGYDGGFAQVGGQLSLSGNKMILLGTGDPCMSLESQAMDLDANLYSVRLIATRCLEFLVLFFYSLFCLIPTLLGIRH
jgi:hypothetical protein